MKGEVGRPEEFNFKTEFSFFQTLCARASEESPDRIESKRGTDTRVRAKSPGALEL